MATSTKTRSDQWDFGNSAIVADEVVVDSVRTDAVVSAASTLTAATVTGNLTTGGIIGGLNNITAGTGGAISVATLTTTINTDAGGDAFTLADGTAGQVKIITLIVDGGGDGVVTPATALGYTTITFGDAADSVILVFTASGWVVVSNVGATLA